MTICESSGQHDPDLAVDSADERLLKPVGVSSIWKNWIGRIKSGDLGVSPVLLSIVVIFGVFQILTNYFISSSNMVNLLTDLSAEGFIALGIVLVLLVAQIDLSVGSMSGVASAILGVGLTKHGLPLWLVFILIVLAAVLVGLVYGVAYLKLGIPSFVATLAGLLALLGFQLKILNTGTLNIPFTSGIVKFMQQMFLPKTLSYFIVAVVPCFYVLNIFMRNRRRTREGLSTSPFRLTLANGFVMILVLELITWFLNRDRGISAPFSLFIFAVVVMEFMLLRTNWGRSVFAVGGSVEAARRAGIKVSFIFMSIFVLCATFAAIGGLLSAGRLASASMSSGVGDTNLDAIAAAVIGGTSLFGGRGSAYSAVLGMLVIQSISNGLMLMSLDSSVRYMVTGVVLFIAVSIDSIARRSRNARGKA